MSTILIVDDEKNLRRLLRDTLEGEGHTVLQGATGEEAVERFQEVSCDLVLLDMILPDLNGLQVLKRMKRLAPDVPVIIMTAYSEVRGAVEAMKAQAGGLSLQAVRSRRAQARRPAHAGVVRPWPKSPPPAGS